MDFWARRSVKVNVYGIGIVLILSTLLYLTIRPLSSSIDEYGLWQPQTLYLALFLSICIALRIVDRMPLAFAGIGVNRSTGKELVWGSLFGIGMALIAWLPYLITGSVTIGSFHERTMLYWILFILTAAFGEELLARGYLFQRVSELLGTTVSVFLFSTLFGLAHLWNDSVNTMAVLNTFLAGVFFSLCYIRTRSLWMPFAAHALWNLSIGPILGMPVSGVSFDRQSVFHTSGSLPLWVSGGAYGPEASLWVTLILVVAIFIVSKMKSIHVGPYTYSGVFWEYIRNKKKYPNVKL